MVRVKFDGQTAGEFASTAVNWTLASFRKIAFNGTTPTIYMGTNYGQVQAGTVPFVCYSQHISQTPVEYSAFNHVSMISEQYFRHTVDTGANYMACGILINPVLINHAYNCITASAVLAFEYWIGSYRVACYDISTLTASQVWSNMFSLTSGTLIYQRAAVLAGTMTSMRKHTVELAARRNTTTTIFQATFTLDESVVDFVTFKNPNYLNGNDLYILPFVSMIPDNGYFRLYGDQTG